MGRDGAERDGRVPVRVVLHGEPDGWHAMIVDRSGTAERITLDGNGTRWQTGLRRDAEPPWWRRRLADVAESLRARLEMLLADRCFELFGHEAEITWLEVEEPTGWEGLVTLRAPDPARFPGRVPPFVLTLEPGRGVALPTADLHFDTLAADAWTALEGVAHGCGTAPPRAQFLCGWTDHRNVRVGRGLLAVSTERGPDGVERIGEVFGKRSPGWGGNPELRVRLDGIDLLHDRAEHVLGLLQELGYDVVERGRAHRLPVIGLTLFYSEGEAREHFAAVSLQPPAYLKNLMH